ncbi:MAG: recombinase RecT [Bacteroidales bacterium]
MEKLSMEELNKLPAHMVAEHERIKSAFVSTFSKIHKVSEDEALSVYDKETLYFKKAVLDNTKLQTSTRLSLYAAFMELAIQGLSIQPGSKSEAFLEARGVKVGTGYVDTAFLRITAYGELNLRIKSGQIVRMYNPQIIYEGDHFQPTTDARGKLIVEYSPAIPRKSNVIVGGYVCIQLPGGDLDFKWLLIDDIERLKKYATTKTQNGSYTNPLYSKENGGIDPGFLEAKVIKHAMRAYTKLRVGENVMMDEEEIETPITPSNNEYEEPQGNIEMRPEDVECGF